MIGLIYFMVIVVANAIGAISGMGGGVLIKPVLDLFGFHSVAAISFYSTVAVFTMSIVSTIRQLKNGVRINWPVLGWVSFGAVIGGFLGNSAFEGLLLLYEKESTVQIIQIVLTVATLLFALLYSKNQWRQYDFKYQGSFLLCGLFLGFLASLLGIGGGPINVSLLMLLFSLPIKEATVYSIGTIFFSQLSKLLTIAFSSGFGRYDLSLLLFIVPAAIVGGFMGAKFSKVLSEERVTTVFQLVIVVVLLINLFNGWKLM
ncbi:hypothetical protein NRIC_20720 [Enterococcus florum]|uniref:Probable membrane transporter protein n=1 Tax=Enterococcus florum TaxID=2480627 RepID=A0A4P5PCY4_9ENTE|nr:sulfite exporter TauE/SafE family protein [Enterococcus florum]GCF94181.1 hypothetical protein NRIC_20720 [Enterococcus florum]